MKEKTASAPTAAGRSRNHDILIDPPIALDGNMMEGVKKLREGYLLSQEVACGRLGGKAAVHTPSLGNKKPALRPFFLWVVGEVR